MRTLFVAGALMAVGWCGAAETTCEMKESTEWVCVPAKPVEFLRAVKENTNFVLRFEVQTPTPDGSSGGGKADPFKQHAKKPGEWNLCEIRSLSERTRILVNGVVGMDADTNILAEQLKKSGNPNHDLKLRHVRMKEVLPDYAGEGCVPKAPEGFTVLFNGKDLTNWKGVTTLENFDNPLVRQAATPEKRAAMQKIADERMREHWHVRDNGVLFFDGLKGGYSIATAKDYGDFEMLVDWRLLSVKGDSGLYLRGSPQVQIWDAHNQWNIGSGGLYNNKKNPDKPSKIADRLPGDWNTFRIKMVGEKVWVWLNGELVVDNVTLENYWDRNLPIFPTEQIELQCHGAPLEFRNIFIRELPR